jgi:hypothetical protein
MNNISRQKVLGTLAIGGTALTVTGWDRMEGANAKEAIVAPVANPLSFGGKHQPKRHSIFLFNSLYFAVVDRQWTNYARLIKVTQN